MNIILHSVRRRWRLLALIVLAGVSLIALYRVASLVSTSAKILGAGKFFDSWRGPFTRQTLRIGAIEADTYRSSRSQTPLLFVHGVNETGKDSIEIRRVAEALAGSGFRVVVPEFVRMTKQNVTRADIDDVVLTFQSLADKAGMVCVSYGCGPALIAASRPEIRDQVRFVVAFGGYFDFTETLRSIIVGPDSPLVYSKWKYMAANSDLLRSGKDRQRIQAIAEERMKRPAREWTVSESELSFEGRALLELYESRSAAEFDVRVRETPALRERMKELSPSRYFDGLRAQLIIVHMISDPAIPSTQSVRMAQAAKARGILSSLTILKMNGHTSSEWPELGVGSLFRFYIPEGAKFIWVLNEVSSFTD